MYHWEDIDIVRNIFVCPFTTKIETFFLRDLLFFSFISYTGKVWAGLHSLGEIETTSGKMKQREFTKKDVSIYESNKYENKTCCKMYLLLYSIFQL